MPKWTLFTRGDDVFYVYVRLRVHAGGGKRMLPFSPDSVIVRHVLCAKLRSHRS